MGNIDVSQENQDSSAWTEEKGLHPHSDSGGSRNARHQSRGTGHQQKRANRTDSSESGFLGTGTTVTGGILRQLISEYRDQMAAKQQEVHRIKEEAECLENEIERIQSRIQEFEALEEELKTRIET